MTDTDELERLARAVIQPPDRYGVGSLEQSRFEDGIRAAFEAAANPATILDLLSANREMRKALEEIADYGGGIMTADDACELARSALTTQRGDGE